MYRLQCRDFHSINQSIKLATMTDRKTAVVTGSTSGIGLGIATRFAQDGLNIVLSGIEDDQQIEPLRARLEKDHGVSVKYVRCDLSSAAGARDLIQAAQASFGCVHVLVNNAGIQHVAPVDEFPDEKWEAVMALNLSAAFYTCKAVLPMMKQQGWGRVINIASAHALVASPLKSAYVAAKHGLLGFTKTLALEVAEQGITVNAICPGYVWTPLVEKQIPETAAARGLTPEQVINDVILSAHPNKAFVTIDQVASVAQFLSSSGADSITGTAVPVDGGWTAR